VEHHQVKQKSVVTESEQLQLAIRLINLGARLQLLESHTSLSRERLIKLYKELKGNSPPKGMLPFSTDWFLTWLPNIHSSLFLNIYNFLRENAGIDGIEALATAYELYLDQARELELTTELQKTEEPVLSLVRAWTLVRFVQNNLIKMEPCSRCTGLFLVNSYDLNQDYLCNLCHIPSRAGKYQKTRKTSDAQTL
jgi:flagellar transcriptional activator FlhC